MMLNGCLLNSDLRHGFECLIEFACLAETHLTSRRWNRRVAFAYKLFSSQGLGKIAS